MAAEDLSKMSLSGAQIEDILHQLQSRQHVTQLSLEEQKLLMSLEHLNNKLKCMYYSTLHTNLLESSFLKIGGGGGERIFTFDVLPSIGDQHCSVFIFFLEQVRSPEHQIILNTINQFCSKVTTGYVSMHNQLV